MATVKPETYTTGPKPTIDKDPNAVLDYSFDWTAWLAPLADSIESVEFVLQSPLTKTGDSFTPNEAVVWVGGGTVGATFSVTCRITTTQGRTDDRTVFLKIVER